MKERDDTQAELARFGQDVAWFEAHYQELLAQYPEQWVAVLDHHAIGADPDIDQLLHRLHQQGVPLGRVFVDRVTTQEDVLILPA
jgi:hypothetical protein